MGENAPVNVLASRYASKAMIDVFAPAQKIIAERKLWLAVARAQSKHGHPISGAVIADYERVLTTVNQHSIDEREKITRHDVKARIEEFNALAGHEVIHAGMTSRDVTENIEAMQVQAGLQIVHDKTIALLAALGNKASKYADQPIAGRSHNVPAQVTTLGKRFASAAEELLFAYQRLASLQARFPMRGIKGPVGTAQDSIDLLGSTASHYDLEASIAQELGFKTAVTTRPGVVFRKHAEHLMALPRISLNGNFQSPRYAKVLISGAATGLWNGFRPVNVT